MGPASAERKMKVNSGPEPIRKPIEPDPRHSSTPAWTPDCAAAGPTQAASAAAAHAPIHQERIMIFPRVDLQERRYRSRAGKATASPPSLRPMAVPIHGLRQPP